jgi:hypothetical protein
MYSPTVPIYAPSCSIRCSGGIPGYSLVCPLPITSKSSIYCLWPFFDLLPLSPTAPRTVGTCRSDCARRSVAASKQGLLQLLDVPVTA